MGLIQDSNTSLKPSVALPLLAVISGLLYITYTVIYNLFFHPLRKFPGPKLWALHYGFYARLELSGEGHRRMVRMHMKYGPVIRVAPNHLAFCHPDAMNDLSSHRKPGQLENGKEESRSLSVPHSIIGASRTDHTRMRKAMTNGFSQQSMISQQPLIKVYIDKLFEKFKEASKKGDKIDAVAWYNYTTFDIVGDLAFGEPFGCLQESTYHPWVDLIFKSIKGIAFDSSFRRMGYLHAILMSLIPKSMKDKFEQHKKLSEEKVLKRLKSDTDRKDFIASMASRKGKDELTLQELAVNAGILVIGGSETTATALSAATYFLGTNQEPLKKLCEEVRSAFNNEAEIDLFSVGRLNYMLAVLDETMRLHAPVPATTPRTINELGDTIAGYYVPPGTNIDIWYWTMFHYPEYWTQAEDFIPERWLGDSRFEHDKRQIFTPFSVGPRNCIGKNLAYAEMRLILAKLIWNFDIEIAEESIDWDKKCGCYILYEKGPLYVYLKPRKNN
ncbi:cytochrome P450 [Trichoderma gamsii]|uniref:Cytochrome P450 n=1 Tax=Trichoderma gamsii TaxID=398673 RepID=A0A2P4ZLW9_9HYPO|nr:cytochrome P450 [Trichoderma gamsii]PON25277.1 cytochrome P450 [Trichoderma gamsii]